MENKVKNVLSGIGFYGTLAVCLLVVGVCGWVLLQDREDPLPQQAVTPQVPVSQPVEMPEVRLPTVETLEPAPVPVPPKETKELPEVEVDHTPVAAEAPRLVVTPLRGDVLTAFSMEELVYSPTLGDWRTHNGVDIAAVPGSGPEQLMLRELAEQEDEACLLLRRSDLLPLYAAGDLTAVLGVGVDTLRNDLAAVLMQLQTPEEGRRF